MTEIKMVYCQVGPDRVTEGEYIFDGNTVTMMGRDDDGNSVPVLMDNYTVSENATPETAVAIAKVLTKRIRRALHGHSVKGFEKGSRIDYSGKRFEDDQIKYLNKGIA